ncbi:DNA-directed RNA polymerase subunit B [Candidatus Woesearchaeota archaeon]|jgi:DNA-directed RNA polymerase subunit B|nr:DNA-directed RNA polymerase subunit B [Candidatus Woesearchaeota archaeon]MBT4387843.1 DNA-directed RNA polymerase subunit B [Candidatus Woesearchaeota archaeon]MBT4595662.1 DNA-directed RNA polymerase subunit B [Candidatus Woesearchaeota archaeon]MBT5740855.1 DNA-directed RNA polymerase subunit B [Candidatus Woesearchaeota archaeon]MBT6505604.1 DNA-directed RNA polymerase subunit B [Candidatus Woesearchaeota archaeon]
MTDVFFDNKFIGTVDDGNKFVDSLRISRQEGKINSYFNLMFEEESDSVFLYASEGRVQRPLIVVKDGKSILTDDVLEKLKSNQLSWSDLIKKGIIEYLDASEEENCFIAFEAGDLTSNHTHLEVSPLSMFAFVGSLVPHGNLTPAMRTYLGAKNQKQAIGLYAMNYLMRIDTDVNLLEQPQIPILKTIMHDISDYSRHPAGQNVIMAIMSYEGYNMDDAIIMNKSSVERGLGRSYFFKPESAEEIRYAGGLKDNICIPDLEIKGYRSEHDYRLLEDDGIIALDQQCGEDDVVIGRTSPPRFLNSSEEYSLTQNVQRESSIVMKHEEKGKVDMVLLTQNEDGNNLVQIRLRDQRIPEVGDKYASRSGQKGVIGALYEQADLPFTASGLIPDIIFSPHSIPTRETFSHLTELIAQKVGVLSGRYVDGTMFNSEEEFDLRNQLSELGFREDGTEVMYNGFTGEKMDARIFVGSIFYLKIKHMVANKIQARATGRVTLLTRQPTEGRSKEGGLRIGEMEKDCIVAHGTSLLLKERFDVDKTTVPVCERSGLIAFYDRFKKRTISPLYGTNSKINYVDMAYAFKLFLDELMSYGIYPKIALVTKY